MDRHDPEQPGQGRDGHWAGDLLTGRRVGEFVIDELLGEGGFGTVYRARQEALARDVVIKVLSRRSSRDGVEHFLREAKLASRLDHPYAAHVYAFGAEDDGVLWIAMELVRGTPLRELLETQGSLPLGRFVPLLEKICEVVYTAHQQGIVHRDIKPSNVMVVARAGQLLPKLLDFGIARLASEPDRPETPKSSRKPKSPDGPETHEGAASGAAGEPGPAASAPKSAARVRRATERSPYTGSPPYMAPEQWVDAASADARSDQYALAVLSYEALTGHLPFRASSDMGFALAHATRPVPPLGSGFPPALDEVLQRALSKNPADRYPDVMQLAAALRAAAGLDEGQGRLPRLPPAARDNAIARAPQPLADTVAFLDAARTATRARDAAVQVVHVALRLLGLLAVAAVRRMGPGAGEDARAARAALRRLHGEPLSSPDWLALARALVHPFATRLDAHPIPELVLLFYGPDGEARPAALLEDLAEREARLAGAGAADEADALIMLGELLPELAHLLGTLSFLCDYTLVVQREGRAEVWMGARRSARPTATVRGRPEPAEGEVGLIAPDGEWLVTLSPLLQLLSPAPGVPDEIFLFDGLGRHGARLVAPPIDFERHDPDFWTWYRAELVDDDAAPGEEAGDQSAAGGAPYLGLSSFSAADAANYVGREREVEACVNRLRIEPLLAVVGPSGAGKSSFVQAGIIPALAGAWQAISTRPGPSPLATLAARLEREGIAVPDLRPALLRDPGALAQALRRRAAATGQRLLLVIDQFEELLTLCHDPEEQRLYADALVHAARSGEDPVRVVLTLRDDFLLRVQQLPALRERLTQSLQLLATPPVDDLERILVEPAHRSGYAFEDEDLPQQMVATVAGEPGALALLSFTAARLWELRDRERRRLTRRAYHALGGVGGALAQHAEDTLQTMPPGHQALVREVFRHLVTADGTRAVLRRSELDQILGGGDAAAAVLEILIHARLLVASEGDAGEDRVEVVHEALLSSWPRLVGWQREDAEGARLRDQLRAAARQWVERNRPRGMLWRGDALLEYRVWRARYRGALTDAEHEFARASLGEETRGRRLRRLAVGTAFVVLCAGMVIVLQQRDRADAAALRATAERDRAEALANESRQRLIALYLEQGRQKLAEGDPLRAFPYLAEARKSGEDGTAVRFLLARATQALDGQELVLRGHQGPVWDARFSPDGARIATASSDKTARIWDARTGALVHTLGGFDADVWRVRFTPDGQRLLTASLDGSVKMWTVSTGALLWTSRHEARVAAAEISRDGAMVATSSMDNTVKLWSVADGRLLHSLAGHAKPAGAVAFSPDGAYLVTGSNDQSARVWSTATGAAVAASVDHGSTVNAIAVSPDGARVASLSWTGRARVFPLRGGRAVELASPGNSRHIAFAPDGQRLVTASEDGMARIWDATSGALLWTLSGHQGAILHASFTPDGQSVITCAMDSTTRRWSASTGRLEWTFFGHRDGIWSADLDAAGERLVTASSDGTARVWTARQQRYVRALHAPGSVLMHASFAPDGERIATIERSGAVRVWDRDGAVAATMTTDYKHASLPYRVWWSPDGERLLSSGGARAIVWDARTGARLLELGHGRWIPRASWARDGARIATAGEDGAVRLWDARDGTLLQTLTGHEKPVTAVELDPGGRQVMTTSLDRTVRLWDAATGASLRTVPQHTMEVTSGRYSADGSLLITASVDTTARIFTAGGEPVRILEGHGGGVLDAVLGPDGRLAATASADGTAVVWDAATGTSLWTVDLGKRPVHSVELSANGRLLLLTAGEIAEVLDVTFDDRPASELEAFSMCRVGYVVERGQLERVDGDPAICAGQL
jgi:WD40 repeat protein/serine/threonine protein kinase